MEFEKKVALKEESPENNEDQMTLSQFYKDKTSKPSSMVVAVDGEKSKTSNGALIDEGKGMSWALEHATEVRKSLDPKFPSFVKSMLRSHVTLGFWLGLPSKFCNLYLPKEDVEITLVDENKEEHTTKLLSQKHGLSAGWRAFSIAHGLVEGDALIFHLVKTTEFQVIIIKANNSGVPRLLTQPKRNDSRKQIKKTSKRTEAKRPRTLKLSALQPPVKNLKNRSGEDVSEVLEGIRLSQNDMKFQEIKSLDNFNVIVNGLNIDFELSKFTRSKYYELSCSQNGFLHDKLLKGMNYKLAVGIISETVNIADAINSSKLRISRNDDLALWDMSLGAFEQLGMNVGFLRDQLQQLVSTAAVESDEEMVNSNMCSEDKDELAHVEVRDPLQQLVSTAAVVSEEEMINSKMCSEDIDELAHVEEDIRSIRTKIMELKRGSKRCGS